MVLLNLEKRLENNFEDKGLDKNKLQITYCTTGVRASYVAVILTELGYKSKKIMNHHSQDMLMLLR